MLQGERDRTYSDSSAFLGAVFLLFPPLLSPAVAAAFVALVSVSTGSGTFSTMSLRKSKVSFVCTVRLLFPPPKAKREASEIGSRRIVRSVLCTGGESVR